MVALGLVNLALSLWRRDFTLSTGVLVGALLLLGVSSLLRSLSPQLSRQDKIEEQDERNILVNLKTRTSAFRWTRLVSFGLMALLLVAGAVTGEELREALGLRSACFQLRVVDEVFQFTVHGWGHGVGMSQAGAAYLASQGESYQEILAHYYPGTGLDRA